MAPVCTAYVEDSARKKGGPVLCAVPSCLRVVALSQPEPCLHPCLRHSLLGLALKASMDNDAIM